MNGKTRTYLVGTALVGSLLLSGCETAEERLARQQQETVQRQEQQKQREEAEKVRIAAEQIRIEKLYETVNGFAHYVMPQIEITAQKSSLSLDPMVHIGNAMKAQTITLPVSPDYFTSVHVGQELASTFNTGGFIFDGNIESYDVTISNKKYTDLYCIITESGWQQTDRNTFQGLARLNGREQTFTKETNDVYLKEGKVESDPFTRHCKVEIESYKTNFTLDIFKHITNSMNAMHYTVEFPGFICDRIKPGDILDQNFVGASIFFSSSLSQVTFKVKNKQ
jgi:hypothetical protein